MKAECDICEWAWWRPSGGDGEKYKDKGVCLATCPPSDIQRNAGEGECAMFKPKEER